MPGAALDVRCSVFSSSLTSISLKNEYPITNCQLPILKLPLALACDIWRLAVGYWKLEIRSFPKSFCPPFHSKDLQPRLRLPFEFAPGPDLEHFSDNIRRASIELLIGEDQQFLQFPVGKIFIPIRWIKIRGRIFRELPPVIFSEDPFFQSDRKSVV